MTDIPINGYLYAGTNPDFDPTDPANIHYSVTVGKPYASPLIKQSNSAIDDETVYYYSQGILFQFDSDWFAHKIVKGSLVITFTFDDTTRGNCWVNNPENNTLSVPLPSIANAIQDGGVGLHEQSFSFVDTDGNVIHDPIIRVTRPPQ